MGPHSKIKPRFVVDPNEPAVELVSQTGGTVEIKWSEPTEPRGPIDGYQYGHSSKGSLGPPTWVLIGSRERSAIVENLQTETTYIFRVEAFNRDSKGRRLYSPPGILEVFTINYA